MINVKNGEICLTKELIISPNYTFEEFKKCNFYKGQNSVQIIYLEETIKIEDRNYMVSLFFRNEQIYIVSLVCCDWKFSELEEKKRKEVHDKILKEKGLAEKEEFHWGKIVSDYDVRSNISSINIIYN